MTDELRAGQFDVVHLAVHGRGDVSRGDRGAVCLADENGAARWVPFEELAALRWDSELVAFSGCSTGMSGPQFGHDLVGVARSALEAGAPTVLACLWPVGDQVAKIFMTAFYGELAARRSQGVVDLRNVVSAAQLALRHELQAGLVGGSGRRRDGRREVAPDTAGGSGDPSEDISPPVREALGWGSFILIGDCMFGEPAVVPES